MTLLVECNTQRMYNGEMENWLNGIFSKLDIIGKHFLINFTRKIARNVFINILENNWWGGGRMGGVVHDFLPPLTNIFK